MKKTIVAVLAFVLLFQPLVPVFAQEVVSEKSVLRTSADGGSGTLPQAQSHQEDNKTEKGTGEKSKTDISKPSISVEPSVFSDTPTTSNRNPNKRDDAKKIDERETEEKQEMLQGGDEESGPALTSNKKQVLPQIDNLTGALTYKYDLVVPPGRNNLVPEVSLSYNSALENIDSIAGYGWSIRIPSIERINRDGLNVLYSGNAFSSSIGGELAALDSDSFVPKVQTGSFVSYERVGDAWVAIDKQGIQYTFGTTTQARQDDPNDSSRIFKWMLEEVRDTNGNFVRYEYTKDAGQIYPSAIVYTGHGTTDGPFEVSFRLAENEHSVVNYSTGFKVKNNFLVDKVSMSVLGDNVRWYGLSYVDGHNGGRKLLQSIVESGKDTLTATTTLPATEFEYQAAGGELVFDQEDSPKNQIPSYHLTDEDGGYQYVRLNLDVNVLADVNGDGLTDFVNSDSSISRHTSNTINDNDNQRPRVYLNTGNGFVFDPNKYQLPSYWLTDQDGGYQFVKINSVNQLIDVNGDGLSDIVHTNADHNRYTSSTTTDNNNPRPRVYLNTGNGWAFDPNKYQIPSYWLTDIDGGYQFVQLNNVNKLIDVNGDGLPDIVHTNADHYRYTASTTPDNNDPRPRVYLNTGNGWVFNPDKYQIPSYLRTDQDGGFHFIQLNGANRLVDVNGDGLPDIVHTDADHYAYPSATTTDYNDPRPRVYLNTGNGWEFNPDYYQIPYFESTSEWGDYRFVNLNNESSVQLIDVNGDSLPDFFKSNGNYRYTTNVVTDNVDDDPRVYLNTGNGWKFDPDHYQLPAVNITDQDGGYHFIHTELIQNQLEDVNGDGLIDIVHTDGEYRYAADSITDLDDGKPRIFLNTGNGWEFDPAKYQLPAMHLIDEDGGYRFARLNRNNKLADMNGDGLIDFVHSDAGNRYPTNTVTDNEDSKPRIYLNTGQKSDLLKSIYIPTGATTTISYKPKVILDKNPWPDTQKMTVVGSLATTNGLGDVATTSLEYTDGKYFFHGDVEKPYKTFAGFASVTKTDPAGNVTKTYYHQGNGVATTSGEFADTAARVGMPYRVEQKDATGNLFNLALNKWEDYSVATGTTTSTFVKLVQKTALTYDGDSDHRDTATTYVYDDATGNMLTEVNWGEVTASSTDPSFLDTGSDKFTKTLSYATSTPTNTLPMLSFPSREFVVDQASSTVSDTKYYYDTLSFGIAEKGNVTKQEMLKASSTSSYIDVEKTYNGYGLVTQVKDPRDKATNFVYDAYNLYVASSTNPLSQTTEYQYDYSLGKPKWAKDANGYVFETVYDGLDRVIEEKQPDVASPSSLVTKATYAYADGTFPTSITKTDYLNGAAVASSTVATHIYFDGLGRVIQERRTAEDTNTYVIKDTSYNAAGQKWRETLPYFGTGSARTTATATPALWSTLLYDAIGRVTAIGNAIGTTTNAYDDWKLTVTDANGEVKDLYKDARGSLVQVDEHNSGSTYTTTYQWNGLGNLTQITDALGNIRSFVYDNLGRRTSAQDLHDPSDTAFSVWTYAYDDAGNVASTTDGKSQIVQYTYDDINRPLTEDFTGAAGTEVVYVYDTCIGGAGKLCTATTTIAGASPVGTAYTYDALGRPITESKTISGAAYVTAYEYDRQGNQTLITLPDNSQLKYEYNPAGMAETIYRKESGGSFMPVVTDIDYSPEGKITYQANSNGTATTNTYDSAHVYRLSNKTTTSTSGGGSTLQNISYTYDNVGNITELSQNTSGALQSTVVYTYDDLHRLTSASTTAAASTPYRETYAYNAIGNITNKSDLGAYTYPGSSGKAMYANPHAALAAGSLSFGYDRNGNMATSTDIASTTWSYRNMPTMIKLTAGATTTYAYDDQNNRVKYANGAKTTLYPSKFWNIATTTGFATTTTQHIFLNDQAIATVETLNGTPTTYFTHSDHLAGTAVSSDGSGNVAEMLDYYPYGETRVSFGLGGFSDQRKFTGHEYDQDTSLLYMGSRYQNPAIGRFTALDPVYRDFNPNSTQGKLMLADPQLQNSYAYGRNNPLIYTDPDGEFAQILLGTAIGGLLGGAIGGTVAAVSGGNFWEGAKYGAISGATAGLVISTAGAAAPLLGLSASEALITGSAVGNAAGGTLARTAAGETTTPGHVGLDLVMGAAGGMLEIGSLKIQGNIAKNGEYIPNMSMKNLPDDAKTLLSEYQSNGWTKAQSGPIGDPHPFVLRRGELPGNGKIFDAQYMSGTRRGIERFIKNENGSVYYTNSHYGQNPRGSIPFYKLK